jgi:hypothetical protein
MSCGSSNPFDNSDSEEPPPEIVEPYLGLSIFSLLNPRFDVQTASEILQESSAPAFSILYGVFGKDLTNYHILIDSLIAARKPPRVALYALCGPCRKPRRDGSMVILRPEMDVQTFQKAILYNPTVRQEFVDHLTNNIRPIFDLYPELNYVLFLELEDNHSEDSFQAMFELARPVFKDYENVRIVRNALKGIAVRTYAGEWLNLEFHTTKPNFEPHYQWQDSVSFDGSYFNFVGETRRCKKYIPPFEDIKTLIRNGLSQGVDMYVWRPEWQGLPECPEYGAPPVEARSFRFKYIDQIKELMRLRDEF